MMETQTSGFSSVNGQATIIVGKKVYSRKDLT
jgi:hypothetical protein